MDWGTIIITALTSSSFTLVVVAGLGYLARSLIERWLNLNLEKYKAELEATNARELERLRAELKISTFEHETRYAKLYEKQADVIAELYKKVEQLTQYLNRVANILRNKRTKGLPLVLDKDDENKVLQSYLTARNHFSENRLYFTENLCHKLSNFFTRTLASSMLFSFSTEYPPDFENLPLEFEERIKASKNTDMLENATNIYNDLQKAKHDIEQEFRTLLGHTSKTNEKE